MGHICQMFFSFLNKSNISFLQYLNIRNKTQMKTMTELVKMEQNYSQKIQIVTEERDFKPKDSNYCFGQWDQKEIYKYFLFIYHHKQKFQSKSMRKSLKVFKQMARFIKTRNSSQCRTHHQNLMSKAKTLENAIHQFIEDNPSFYQKYNLMKNTLKILDDMDFCEDTSTVVRQAKLEGSTEVETLSTHSSGKGPAENIVETLIILEPPKKELKQNEIRLQKMMQCQVLFTLWANKLSYLTQYPLQ